MTLVIGIGNPDRGDDAAGLAVARRVREATAAARCEVTVVELAGDQLALLDAWDGEKEVYAVDAVWSGATPGTVFRFDAARPLGVRFAGRGTHTFSLADVVELARALGRLPARLTGYGIEGAAFGFGAGLSPPVAAAAEAVAARLLGELEAGG
ncbi:MAG TPA: hydrogenase maturation protease [Trebonia sp.]|nr:hydrogenase maturation protease [Trebonia sp.]